MRKARTGPDLVVAAGENRVALDDAAKRLASLKTRRSVVKTGAKLAYAAPLVAASMSLGANTSAAVSGDGCPPCYVYSTQYGRCIREAVELMVGECPCGFEKQEGQCVKNNCRDCFENVGGICVPENPAPPNGVCQCGFQNIGGICVPRYPMP